MNNPLINLNFEVGLPASLKNKVSADGLRDEFASAADFLMDGTPQYDPFKVKGNMTHLMSKEI